MRAPVGIVGVGQIVEQGALLDFVQAVIDLDGSPAAQGGGQLLPEDIGDHIGYAIEFGGPIEDFLDQLFRAHGIQIRR